MLTEHPSCVKVCFESYQVGTIIITDNLDLIEPKESNIVPRLLSTRLNHLLKVN